MLGRSKKSPVVLALLATLLLTLGVSAAEPSKKLTKVASKQVCMINEQYMEKDQIPVEVDGRMYYGCCAMCVEKLNQNEKSRYAIDPLSGKKVDKALAVIAADEDFNVYYFENDKNLEAFNKKTE